MQMPKWTIGELAPLQTDGRNPLWNNFKREGWTDAHIFVREYEQNVLDNRLSISEAAKVTFEFKTLTTSASKKRYQELLSTPNNHIKASEGSSKLDLENPRILVIREEGTTGFCGDYLNSRADSDWANFFFGAAKEAKSTGKNGRAGQGKIVYYMASEGRSLFVITKRSIDNKLLMMGRANFTKTHMIDDKPYDFNGYFSCTLDNSQPIPTESGEFISSFCEDLGIDLDMGSSGSIYIIPQPVEELNDISIIQTTIQDFFYPVLKGKMSIKTDSTEINQDNLLLVYQEFIDQFENLGDAPSLNYLQFVNECISGNEKTFTSETLWKGSQDDFNTLFSETDIKELQDQFENNDIVRISLPIKVTKKDGGVDTSPLELFLKSSDEIAGCEEAYVRSDLYIAKEKKLKNVTKHAYGLVVSEEGELVDFLANAEEASHLLWNGRESKLEEKYRNVRETLSRVRNSLPRFYSFLLNSNEEIDNNFMIGLLSIPQLNNSNKKAPYKKKIKEKDDIEANPAPSAQIDSQKDFLVVKDLNTSDGFEIRNSSFQIPDFQPLELEVKAAYDNIESAGDPFKKYSHLDFDFSEEKKFNFRTEGCKLLYRDLNIARFRVENHTFKITIRGFNKDHPLKVRNKIREFSK